MNKNRICVKKSHLVIGFVLILTFSLFYLYQTINNSVISNNGQAKTTILCTYITSQGGIINALDSLGVYPVPAWFSSYVNINGKSASIYDSKKNEILQVLLQPGDRVSLLPTDHIRIPCQGEYLGNVMEQTFNDYIVVNILKGGYKNMSGFQNLITEDRMEINLKTLCAQQYNYVYNPYQNPSFDQMGCNFITVVKTAKVGGLTTCKVYSSAKDAYYDYPYPQDFKSISVAVLGKIADINQAQALCVNEGQRSLR